MLVIEESKHRVVRSIVPVKGATETLPHSSYRPPSSVSKQRGEMSDEDSLFMQSSIPPPKRVLLVAAGLIPSFLQTERSMHRVTTTLSLLGIFLYTTLFSAVYNLPSITCTDISFPGNLAWDGLLCLKIVHLRCRDRVTICCPTHWKAGIWSVLLLRPKSSLSDVLLATVEITLRNLIPGAEADWAHH